MAKRQTWIFSNSSWNWYKQQTEIRCLFVLQLQKAYQQLYQDYKAGIIYHFLFSFVKSALRRGTQAFFILVGGHISVSDRGKE